MRSLLTFLVAVLLLCSATSFAQDWSDQEQYDAYINGDWKKVVELGSKAKKQGIDYYYIGSAEKVASSYQGQFPFFW